MSLSRSLAWDLAEGKVELRGSFHDKKHNRRNKYTLLTTILQTIILLMLERKPEPITLSEACREVGIDEEKGKRVLHSISCSKKQDVVRKEPPSSKISNTDTFKLNKTFSSKLRKLALPKPQLEDSTQGRNIEGDRHLAIDAATVSSCTMPLDFVSLVYFLN